MDRKSEHRSPGRGWWGGSTAKIWRIYRHPGSRVNAPQKSETPGLRYVPSRVPARARPPIQTGQPGVRNAGISRSPRDLKETAARRTAKQQRERSPVAKGVRINNLYKLW